MSLRNYKVENVIDIEVRTRLTPEHVAEMFWEMNDEEMSEFFNALGKIADEDSLSMLKQMLAVAKNKTLNPYGVAAVGYIASINEHRSADDHG